MWAHQSTGEIRVIMSDSRPPGYTTLLDVAGQGSHPEFIHTDIHLKYEYITANIVINLNI